MKKILLASTALAMSAGVAAADVTLSGDGRMGVSYTAGPGWTANGRVRLLATFSREGDHGLSFGGRMRFNATWAGGVYTPANAIHGAVWIDASGFRLSMGDTDGAIAQTVSIYGGGLGYTNRIGRPATHAGYSEEGNNQNTVVAAYRSGSFAVRASTRANGGNTTEVAGSYSASGLTVAAGFRQGGNWSASATYASGDFGVGLLASRAGGNNNYRVWGTYDMGDIRLGATFTRTAGTNNYGVGARYSLGGGAFAHGAIGRHNGVNNAEFGVTFAF